MNHLKDTPTAFFVISFLVLCTTSNIATCYIITYTFHSESVSNTDARDACAEDNMTLAYPKTEYEYGKLLDYLDTTGATEVWIGLFEVSAGDWRWGDGTVITYTMWDTAAAEPSSTNMEEACVRVYMSNRKWRDRECPYSHIRYPFVCQSIAPKLPVVQFVLLSSGKIPSALAIVPEVKVDSHIQCAVKCHNLDPCLSFTISDVTKMCGLYGLVDATNVADGALHFYGIP